MIIENDSFGNPVFRPENLCEFRGMATGMNQAGVEWQLPVSQRARYDVSNAIVVLTLVPGNDDISKAITCKQLSEKVAPHGLIVKPRSFSTIIHRMTMPCVSVRKHNRWHGHTIKKIVIEFGGLKEVEVIAKSDEGVQYTTKAYYFGKSNSEINRLRNVEYKDLLRQVKL